MKKILIFVTILTLFGCGKLSKQQGKFFEATVYFKDNELGKAAFGIHKDTMFIFTDIMFGSPFDTFLITQQKDDEFKVKTLQGIETEFTYLKNDNEITSVYYKDLKFSISSIQTKTPLDFYQNEEVSTVPLNYLLFGTYKGTLHTKLSQVGQFYITADYRIKFIQGTNQVQIQVLGSINGLSGRDKPTFDGEYFFKDDYLVIKYDKNELKFLTHNNLKRLELDDDYMEGSLDKIR